MLSHEHAEPIAAPTILRGTTGRYAGKIAGFDYMGSHLWFDPNQDTLTAKQLIHATIAMFGWDATRISEALHINRAKEKLQMGIIFDALKIRNKGDKRLGILPTCLAAEIITINTPVPSDLLSLNSDQLELIRDLSEGQSRPQMGGKRGVGTSGISRRLEKIRNNNGFASNELLVLGAILTRQVVINPPTTVPLRQEQLAVQIPAGVKHFPDMPELIAA